MAANNESGAPMFPLVEVASLIRRLNKERPKSEKFIVFVAGSMDMRDLDNHIDEKITKDNFIVKKLYGRMQVDHQ